MDWESEGAVIETEFCNWFTCVYAVKDFCSIEGYFDEIRNVVEVAYICPYYKLACKRAMSCDVCARKYEKGICKLDER